MGSAAKKKSKNIDPDIEKDQLISEYALIKDRIDALEEMLSVRKNRLLVLLRAEGSSGYTAVSGSAKFQVRRSFKVTDHGCLAKLMTKSQLAMLAKVTADVYDAYVQEGKQDKIEEAVMVGRSESLSISRARTKVEKERRSKHIEESKRQAEQRIKKLREQLA